MSDLENPHYHRKVGYSMILVAASLAAIGILSVSYTHLTLPTICSV